jgi:hypothetical protein
MYKFLPKPSGESSKRPNWNRLIGALHCFKFDMTFGKISSNTASQKRKSESQANKASEILKPESTDCLDQVQWREAQLSTQRS